MSTIKIYKTALTPQRNALVDDIDLYLGSLTPTYTSANFQYQKMGLDLVVKVNLDQQYVAKAIGNYVEIIQDGKSYYYFIMESSWKSTTTVELTLSIDSINTFRNDVTFTEKTKIIRQHKDRFKRKFLETEEIEAEQRAYQNHISFIDDRLIGADIPQTGFYEIVETQGSITQVIDVFINTSTGLIEIILGPQIAPAKFYLKVYIKDYYRIIDQYAEGISPTLYSKKNSVLNPEELSWHLLYYGDASSVYTALCADETIYARIPASSLYMNKSDMVEDIIYYIDFATASVATPKFGKGQLIKATVTEPTFGNTFTTEAWNEGTFKFSRMIAFRKHEDKIQVATKTYRYVFGSYYHDGNSSWKTFDTATRIFFSSQTNFVVYRGTASGVNSRTTIRQFPSSQFTVTATYEEVAGLEKVNRTDSKLIKIVKLPYCPIDYQTDLLGRYEFNNVDIGYDADNDLLLIPDKQKLSRFITTTVENPLDVSIYLPLNLTEDRRISRESKLYHSDFYRPKVIYDTFSTVFALDRCNIEYAPQYFSFNIDTSKLINSSFIFSFPDVNYTSFIDDYEGYMFVNRNNELPLYSSDYLNYLRNGYNYDVKNKDISNAARWVGTGLSIIGSVASFALSGATSGVSAAAGVGLAISSVGSIATNITSQVQSENAIAQKLQEAYRHGGTPSSMEAVDLLSVYGDNNKAKLMVYEVSDTLKSQLYDLFFYCGYATNVQKIPELDTRAWFNFIQCDAEFDADEVYEQYLSDMKARYSSGVTVYHNNMISGERTWDWDQNYENWERSLL